MNNNPMTMIMQMLQQGTPIGQMMNMYNNNPLMQQAMRMGQGKTPGQMMDLFKNVAKEKGIPTEQLEQMGKMFGIPFNK